MADPRIDFYLNSKSNILQYETLQLSHPNFSQVYYLVRNNRLGVSLGVNGSLQMFQFCPFRLERQTVEATFSQRIRVTLGDLGEIVSNEISNVMSAEGFLTRPKVTVRCYRNDAPMTPIYGPYEMEATNITLTREGSAFDIMPPDVANKRTGLVYELKTYPGLRGFV
jgi:hypothetical protein